jgi:acetyl-CoA acetyltransferase
MSAVYVVGIGSTDFKKWPQRTFRDLAAEAVSQCIDDGGFNGQDIEHISFGNCAMGRMGQNNLRGQVTLEPMMAGGTLNRRVPIVNVEAGCATGSVALQSAFRAVASGDVGIAMAVGVEKTVVLEDPACMLALFGDGIDTQHPDEWRAYYTAQAESVEEAFAPHPMRVLFLDLHALLARRHMKRFGLTARQLAAVASKNHHHGSLNERAQYRFEIDVDAVLADRSIVAPLTRAMCAPLSDGAASVAVVSEDVLAGLSAEVRSRAVRIHGVYTAGGAYRDIDAPSISHAVGLRAWAKSGLRPEQMDVVEVHDATAFCEVLHLEELGFAKPGQAGAMAADGATALGGTLPVNTSGGLESKGHPLAATGLGQIGEVVTQLRNEAGSRQVDGARFGAVHNAGGAIGLDEALAAVTLLER